MIEEEFEILLLVQSFESSRMTAIGLRDDSGAAAIVLNDNDWLRAANPLLARVYVAHELCHILHDPSEGGLHLVIDTSSDDTKFERAEQRAKAFAAEFLLPRAGLEELLGPPKATRSPTEGRELVLRARQHFGTPWEITANHLCNHGYLDEPSREQLLREGPRDHRTMVPTRLPSVGAPSIAFANRIQRMHEQGRITDTQAKIALGIALDARLPWE